MFFNEHVPPHFHAKYQDREAQFDIKTLDIIEGDLPRNALLKVREWAELHRTELLENWERARTPAPLTKIEPLKKS